MSDDPANVDLAYVGRALNRLTTEVASVRDDMLVLTSIAMRLDGSHGALLTEVRAMHSQHARLANRVRDLESEAP